MKQKKLGYQARVGGRINLFNSIEINEDFSYCASHNFVYSEDVEKFKFYNALPCYHTDTRYTDGSIFSGCKLYWNRFGAGLSLKSCIRRTLKCRNIPIGTIVDFRKSWFIPRTNYDGSYRFKVRKENSFSPEYEINDPSFADNFTTCNFSKELTSILRENGFIVSVRRENPNFLSSMFVTAAACVGKMEEQRLEDGEIAIAYGYGKKIGFSSGDSSFMGYSNGKDNILYDHYGEFDKWSRCVEIPKNIPIDKIISILKEPNTNDSDE